MPAENKKDFDDLAKYITDGLEIHFATNFDDVYRICFDGETATEALNPDDILIRNRTTAQAPFLG